MEELDIVEMSNCTRYYKKGTKILHREDGPAIDYRNGKALWYINGFLHRLEGPAKELNSYKCWYVNGICHRLDGPAVEYRWGDKEWHVNGKLHRLDGPAIEMIDGDTEWWIDGKRLSPEKETVMNIWYEDGKS